MHYVHSLLIFRLVQIFVFGPMFLVIKLQTVSNPGKFLDTDLGKNCDEVSIKLHLTAGTDQSLTSYTML